MEASATEHKHALAVAMATTAAAQAAVEIIRLTRPALLLKQDKAALFIQKFFRGYLVVITSTISEFSCHKFIYLFIFSYNVQNSGCMDNKDGSN